jgi:hypothetical protein
LPAVARLRRAYAFSLAPPNAENKSVFATLTRVAVARFTRRFRRRRLKKTANSCKQFSAVFGGEQ